MPLPGAHVLPGARKEGPCGALLDRTAASKQLERLLEVQDGLWRELFSHLLH